MEYKICQTVNIKRKLCLALKAALHIFMYEKTECFSSYYRRYLSFLSSSSQLILTEHTHTYAFMRFFIVFFYSAIVHPLTLLLPFANINDKYK